MTDRELYQQKRQAELDEWMAMVDQLKAKATKVAADARLEMNRQIQAIESRIKEGRAKLTELEAASEDAWDSIKCGVDSAWTSLKTACGEAAARFKE